MKGTFTRRPLATLILSTVALLGGYIFAPLSLFAQGGVECPAPADFNLMTPCYANGSRTANPNEPIIVLWNHTASRGTGASKEIIAHYNEVGTVWGLAWHAQTKKLYAAAFLKRHSDLSPDGPGAIYEIDLTTPTTAGAGTPTLWMDLNSVTHLGAGATLFPSETAANRGLGSGSNPSYDLWAFNRVGKQGLGDIDISEDGTTMYVMDLTNRQVLQINMATKTVTNRYPVNTPAGYPNPADVRPFAVKHHNNQLYIGVVGSAESSYSSSDKNAGKIDLRGTIMRLNAGTFTTVFDVDSLGVADPADPTNTGKYTSYRGNPNFGTGWGWYPNFTTDIAPYYNLNDPFAYIAHPVPLISDIEFDNNSNMVIGIMDWAAHRYGNFNYIADPAQTDTRLKSIQAIGDVIQARWNGSAWVKEPGLGRFYDDMQAIANPAPSVWPRDPFVGGLVVTDCSGSELAVANMQDPFDTSEGGVVWMRTSDGFMQTSTAPPASGAASANASAGSRLRIFQGGNGFGKAAGLGDMVAMFLPPCTNPTATAAATNPTCAGGAQGDGSITVSGFNTGDRYQYSTGATFNSGTAIPASITAIPAGGIIVNTLPNTTQQYTVRIYDAINSNCYVDRTVSITAVMCCALSSTGKTLETCNDNSTAGDISDDYITFSLNPTGTNLGATYSVTADNGGIVTLAAGGAATGVAYGSATAFRLQNGSASGTLYTITVTDASGVPCITTTTVQQNACVICVPPALSIVNATVCIGSTVNLTNLVTGNTPLGILTFHSTQADATAGTNAFINSAVAPIANTVYYVRSTISAVCFSTAAISVTAVAAPMLNVANGSVCAGGSIDLSSLVTSAGGGILSFHSTYANAVAGTPIIASTVSPLAATNYYIRSTNSSGCYQVKEVTVTLKTAACGVIGINGPN